MGVIRQAKGKAKVKGQGKRIAYSGQGNDQ